jgi:hypothetical protein
MQYNGVAIFAFVKNAIVILTAAAILISSMGNAVLFAGFKLNQAEIEQLHCVNKAKPQKHCHGKCHLKKQLEVNSKKEGSTAPIPNSEDSFHFNIFHQPISTLALKKVGLLKAVVFDADQLLSSRLFGNSLYRPPDNFIRFC